MVLKYVYMLDILIQQFVHMKFFDGTFANSSKLLKKHLITENLNEVKSSSLKKLFFKSLEKSAKCCQKIPCGQTDESKCLAHRHILKPVVKVL